MLTYCGAHKIVRIWPDLLPAGEYSVSKVALPLLAQSSHEQVDAKRKTDNKTKLKGRPTLSQDYYLDRVGASLVKRKVAVSF